MASAEYDKALLDPKAVYSRPAGVLRDPRLNDDQKLKILRRWELDSRELQVAEEEGMTDGEPDMLKEVLEAIDALGAPDAGAGEAPTKHGGIH